MITEPMHASTANSTAAAHLEIMRQWIPVGGFEVTVGDDGSLCLSSEYQQLQVVGADDNAFDAWLARIHPTDSAAAQRDLCEALRGVTASYASEYRIIQPDDGDVRWIRARAEIICDEQGNVRRITGLQMDITAEKWAAVGQLAGSIAHDFNNVLQTLSGSLCVAEMLIEQGRANEANAYLARAQNDVKRASALTRQLNALTTRPLDATG